MVSALLFKLLSFFMSFKIFPSNLFKSPNIFRLMSDYELQCFTLKTLKTVDDDAPGVSHLQLGHSVNLTLTLNKELFL